MKVPKQPWVHLKVESVGYLVHSGVVWGMGVVMKVLLYGEMVWGMGGINEGINV